MTDPAPDTEPEAPVEPEPAPVVRRVRLVAALIQLELVIDDGDVLHPLQVEPLRLAAADLPAFDAAVAVARVQAKIDATAPAEIDV